MKSLCCSTHEQFESGEKNAVFARLTLRAKLPEGAITLKMLNNAGMPGTVQSPRRLRDERGDLYSWAEKLVEMAASFFEDDVERCTDSF